jgi:hypothetical protein
MKIPRIYLSAVGAIDVVYAHDFIKLLISLKQKQIDEVLLNNAIEVAVLNSKQIDTGEEHVEFAYPGDIFTGAYFPADDPTRDWASDITRIKYPFQNTDDDLEGCLLKQLYSCVDIYKHDDLTDAVNAFEVASLESLENFGSPTHIVFLKPKTFIVANPEEWEIQVKDFNGIIKAVIYPTRKHARYAMEAPNVLDF